MVLYRETQRDYSNRKDTATKLVPRPQERKKTYRPIEYIETMALRGWDTILQERKGIRRIPGIEREIHGWGEGEDFLSFGYTTIERKREKEREREKGNKKTNVVRTQEAWLPGSWVILSKSERKLDRWIEAR